MRSGAVSLGALALMDDARRYAASVGGQMF
jgi:hypothetical protein